MSPQPTIDLQHGLEKDHVYPSQPVRRINNNSNRSKASTMNYGTHTRRRIPNYNNYGDPIEFRPRGEDGGPGVTSPPLWKSTSPPARDTTAVQRHNNYNNLSPASRTQAIARGRQELMEMVKHMPESCYELSLRDLVEKPKLQEVEQILAQHADTPTQKKNRKVNKANKSKSQMLPSKSMNNGPVLLKMFLPISLRQKEKSLQTGKVSPRPSVREGEKGGADKEWWKKRSSVTEENENDRPTSIGGSTSSSNSNSNSNSSR
ncbi:hypothetical protein GIB67_029763 [Kingdonia uniflora]|uniref:Uncharacterized protein n=1 Tax=Kingdonia uniflora TaxID=39325 RepID=A0A7J7NIV7_9MAGN|nr:hypothetical protein GIB67_029763 [Kingdonia uniflora]